MVPTYETCECLLLTSPVTSNASPVISAASLVVRLQKEVVTTVGQSNTVLLILVFMVLAVRKMRINASDTCSRNWYQKLARKI